MPTISGNVYYTPNNVLTPTIGIPNVPVVLRNPSLLVGAIALTDANGTFVFNNVPIGSYQLIEAWGTPGGAPTPVDYLTSIVPMPVMPTEAEPPLSALPVAPPALADMLMAVSPNLLNLTVTGNVTALAFYDAPVGSKPIVFNGLQMVGPNLVTAADNGSFGTLPPGSPVNSIPAVAPYPTATPGLPYQSMPEIPDGSYSIVNIRRRVNTGFAWWNLSDHETMLETGRFMFVNGDQPGAVLFTNTIAVNPNTFYTFTGWGGNLLNTIGTPPRFSVKVIGSDGSTLGYQLLNSIDATPIPVWYQAGFLFNSGAFSSVTVEVVSEAPFSPVGNDYVIDELRLFETKIINLLELQKSFAPNLIYSATSGAGQDVMVTVVVTNTSGNTAPNVFFKDIIDPQLQFVAGSVQVNGSGVGFGTADPNLGFSLGNMAPGAVNTVTFHVTTVAAGPVTIPNTATARYDAATNGNGDIITNTVSSNIANLDIIINNAIVTVDKAVDKVFANVGETITYTLTLRNSGNVPANTVTITDAVPLGTTFVSGSVTGATGVPPTLTLLAPIPAGGNAVVTFQVQVGSTIPVPNPIPNAATAAYTFTIDPAHPDGGSGTAQSDTVETQVNSAILATTKNVDASYAETDQILTYTLSIHNSGSVAANNVIITDPIPADTTFVVGSVTGATGVPPSLSIASIPAGSTAVVTFKVKVSSAIPTTNPIVNAANLAFSYTVDPAHPEGASGTSASNSVTTQVNDANIVTSKTVDKAISDIGGVLTYTITLTNTGNMPANNVIITDAVPNGTSFINGSLLGATGTPPTLNVASIPSGGSAVVSYQVLIADAIPSPNPVPNTANVAFTFTLNPENPNGAQGTSTSNTVNTLVNSAIINTIKSADLAFANVGDTITYTITVTNSGNVTANNVILTDNIPNGTTFIPGSLTGATGVPPALTLNAPIPSGGSAVVTYKVLVGSAIPNPNPIENSASTAFTYTVDPLTPNGASGLSYSNITETEVNTAMLKMTKNVDKFIAYIGDTITYQIAIQNTGNTAANNVVITDPVPVGTVLVPGSMVVSVPFTTLPSGAIQLTNPIIAGGLVTISFKVLVTAIPNPNPIINIARADYTYTVDPLKPNGESGTNQTNPVSTTVFRNNFGQQISDLIESVALEQAALAAIANAEGAKIQRLAAMPGITTAELLCLNKSVTAMTDSITLLESILKQKLSIVDCQIDGNVC